MEAPGELPAPGPSRDEAPSTIRPAVDSPRRHIVANEIVPPPTFFLINWQPHGVESSCGHKDSFLSQVI